jgi:hypothetical protein
MNNTNMFLTEPSGEITGTGVGHISFAAGDGWRVAGYAVDPKTEYWNGTALTPRPTNPATINKTICTADGFDTITIQNAAGKLFLDGIEYPIIDPEIHLTFEDIGAHRVRITNFPIQDFEVTVNAN